MVASLPPSGPPERAKVFWNAHVAQLCTGKQCDPSATISNPTQVNTRADEQQTADSFGFQIPGQGQELCISTSPSVCLDNNAARRPHDINKKVTLIWS